MCFISQCPKKTFIMSLIMQQIIQRQEHSHFPCKSFCNSSEFLQLLTVAKGFQMHGNFLNLFQITVLWSILITKVPFWNHWCVFQEYFQLCPKKNECIVCLRAMRCHHLGEGHGHGRESFGSMASAAPASKYLRMSTAQSNCRLWMETGSYKTCPVVCNMW